MLIHPVNGSESVIFRCLGVVLLFKSLSVASGAAEACFLIANLLIYHKRNKESLPLQTIKLN